MNESTRVKQKVSKQLWRGTAFAFLTTRKDETHKNIYINILDTTNHAWAVHHE